MPKNEINEIAEMGIGIDGEKVVIRLSACNGWLAMSRGEALAFAQSIEAMARQLPQPTTATMLVGEAG